MKYNSKYAISVIIPVYNNTSELQLTLNALDKQTMVKDDFEVLIVDDGSSEDMQTFLKNYPQFNLQYHYQEDLGFRPGQARNMGIRNAQGTVCVFIDCGILLNKDALEKHRSIHNLYNNAVVIGYIYGVDKDLDLNDMRNIIDSNPIEDAVHIMHSAKMIDGRESLYQEHGDELSAWPAPWVVLWSAHFSVKSDLLATHNIYFDDHFTTWGCEDNDFGIQLYQKNCRFILRRDIPSIHYPPTVRSYDRFKDPIFKGDFKQNKQYVARKYPHDRSVQLWYEKGMFNVNRIMLQNNRDQ